MSSIFIVAHGTNDYPDYEREAPLHGDRYAEPHEYELVAKRIVDLLAYYSAGESSYSRPAFPDECDAAANECDGTCRVDIEYDSGLEYRAHVRDDRVFIHLVAPNGSTVSTVYRLADMAVECGDGTIHLTEHFFDVELRNDLAKLDMLWEDAYGDTHWHHVTTRLESLSEQGSRYEVSVKRAVDDGEPVIDATVITWNEDGVRVRAQTRLPIKDEEVHEELEWWIARNRVIDIEAELAAA